jgi:hypothetical protein
VSKDPALRMSLWKANQRNRFRKLVVSTKSGS